MAHIKCKYRRWRCGDGTYEHGGQICEHHTMWGEYDECCDYAEFKPYTDENGTYIIPVQCRFVREEIVMFEKDVKSWELNDDGLTIKGRSIPADDIKYLIIDGETLVKEQEHD